MKVSVSNISYLIFMLIVVYYFANNKSTTLKHQFQQWKIKYQIQFSSELEQKYRQLIFYKNIKLIEQHNANVQNTYKMGINQFTGLTQQEFVHLYLGTNYPISKIQEIIQIKNEQKLSLQIDWTFKGAVTPVKNQGQCGSCWAFSTTGSLEGLYQISTGTLKSFSQQQLMDCSGGYGNMGCSGGTMSNSFNYVRDHGICQDQQYPYKATKQSCKKCTSVFNISGYSAVTGCQQLVNALSSLPISVVVDATNWSSYNNGIFNKCGVNLNHGVLVVGMTGGVWKIKNSWGNTWGEHGYIRLAPDDTCGVCRNALVLNLRQPY